ncbi:MAG: hypothetical protein N2483_02660 [Burkholderiaceae bacterium]|nr:hypothetical protein [Burkholderiaceae bacterium]
MTSTNAAGSAAVTVAVWPALVKVTHVSYRPFEFVATAPGFRVVELEKAIYQLPEFEVTARKPWPWWLKAALAYVAGKALRWW